MKEKGIQWSATRYEAQIIGRIAELASKLAKEHGVDYDITNAMMDIEGCHCNGNPLDLAELEKAPDGDFAHDVFGILRHIDRTTGELKDCFSPRYSLHEKDGNTVGEPFGG